MEDQGEVTDISIKITELEEKLDIHPGYRLMAVFVGDAVLVGMTTAAEADADWAITPPFTLFAAATAIVQRSVQPGYTNDAPISKNVAICTMAFANDPQDVTVTSCNFYMLPHNNASKEDYVEIMEAYAKFLDPKTRDRVDIAPPPFLTHAVATPPGRPVR